MILVTPVLCAQPDNDRRAFSPSKTMIDRLQETGRFVSSLPHVLFNAINHLFDFHFSVNSASGQSTPVALEQNQGAVPCRHAEICDRRRVLRIQ